MSRDRLIDELWGERPPATATKLVQVYVSRLRKVLEPDRSGGPGEMLITQAPGYLLRVGSDELDLYRFERLLDEGRQALSAGSAADAADRFREALALWRGPPLADFTFERFAEAEIGRLEELRLAALEDRIEADLALGRTDQIAELEALIARHPVRERLRGQLMLALYRSGRQSEALEAYRDTRRTLVEEAGVEPGPSLQRLERAILAQDPALSVPKETQRPKPLVTPAAGDEAELRALQHADASAAGAFVGRERELEALLGGLAGALGGQGRLFLVTGEAGIGKSRLLDELAVQAGERGARVLWGRCWEAGGAPAYWPWVQSLRGYIRSSDRDALGEELGPGAAEMAQVLPELRELFEGLPEPSLLDPETARFRLFEAVASFLIEAARSQPLVLVLDDLHAADEPSLLLLQFVAGQLRSAPLLIAGAYRDAELESDTPLSSLLAALARERVTRRLALRGLEKSDVGRLIEASGGLHPPERSVAAIHRGTEGNPLFVGEVVRLLSSEGRLAEVSEAAPEPLPIPTGVREVIVRRLRHLSEDCRGVLTLGAVLGREFDFDALAQLDKHSEDELLDAVEEALRARVLSEVPTSPSRLRFAHVLIRDTLYAEVGGPRRLRLHREAAEALEAHYASDSEPHLAELAHHFVAAGEAGDAAKAVSYAHAAGDRAVRLFAYEEAVRLYGMALSALPSDGAPSDRVRCELLLALADAQSRAGDGPEARSNFLRAGDLARSVGLPEVLAEAAVSYGGRFAFARAATDERLVPLLEDALSALGPEDSVQRVQLLARLAGALRGEPSRERRERVCEEAVGMARRLGDDATLAYALDAADALHGPDTAERRMAEAGEIVSLAARIGDPERLWDGHEHGYWSAWELGDPDRRAADLASVLRVADELRQPAQLSVATTMRAALALSEGRFREAEELIERAARLGERALSWAAPASNRFQEFVLRREQDRLEGHGSTIRHFAHELAAPLMHRSMIAYACARHDDTVGAAAVLAELHRHDLSDWHVDEDWLAGISLLAEACTIIEDTESAAALYELLLPYSSLNAVSVPTFTLGSVGRPLGMLATLLGRSGDATGHFEEALAMNMRMGARPWVAHTEHDYAQMLAARDEPGDREHALELAHRALEGYRSLDMDAFAAQAADLERSLTTAAP